VIPRASRALTDLAVKLATDLAPEMRTEFGAANAGLMSLLLLALAQEQERAVAVRMADVEEISALFTQAEQQHPEAAGAGERAAWCECQPKSLMVSDVDRFHGRGLELLIALHIFAETEDAELDQAIWDFLARHTERHGFALPAM